MATKLILRRKGSALLPFDAGQEALLRTLPPDKPVSAVVTRAPTDLRLRQLALYWCLCDDLATAMNAMGRETTQKEVDRKLRAATGFCTAVELSPHLRRLTGHAMGIELRSISMDQLDDDEWEAFLNRATRFIAEQIFPHLPASYIRNQIAAGLRIDP